MPDEIPMPPGGAERGETTWSAAEKLAEAHEADLRSKGVPVPGEQAGSIVSSEHAPTEGEKPEVVAAKKPAAKPVAGDTDKAAIRKQIEELAAKAGMKVDGNRVEVAERVALREERRVMRETAARELQREREKLGIEMKAAADSRGKSEAFNKALESRDFDGMAKASGFKDWRDMLNEQTRSMASPEYREIQELKKRDAERDAAIKTEREQREQWAAQQQQLEGIKAYKVSMAEDMRTRGGELEPMAEDPDLVNMLYDVRADHFRRTRDELDLEELLDTPTPLLGGKSPLDKLRAMRDSLNAIFGDHPSDQDEAASAAARRGGQSARSRERKPPKVVSQRNAAEASAPPEFKDDAEFKRYFTGLLNQSTHVT